MDKRKTLSLLDPIIIMSGIVKLEIFDKNKDFNFAFNNFKNNRFFHRESRINEILDEKVDIKESVVFGEPYDSPSTNIISLSNVSHTIEFLSIENDRYYGHIKLLDTPMGKTFIGNEDILILRPVYFIHLNEILTFNIDIDRKQIYKRILNRK